MLLCMASTQQYQIVDIWRQICLYLTDRDKLSLFSTCHWMWNLRFETEFDTWVWVSEIINVSYFHRFVNVLTDRNDRYRPEQMRCMRFCLRDLTDHRHRDYCRRREMPWRMDWSESYHHIQHLTIWYTDMTKVAYQIILPIGLKSLHLQAGYMPHLILPNGLQTLSCGYRQMRELEIPSGLKRLNCSIVSMEKFTIRDDLLNLKHLFLTRVEVGSKHRFFTTSPDVVPEGLSSMALGRLIKYDLEKFFSTNMAIQNLRKLYIYESGNPHLGLIKKLPSLRELTIRDRMDISWLPPGLQKLKCQQLYHIHNTNTMPCHFANLTQVWTATYDGVLDLDNMPALRRLAIFQAKGLHGLASHANLELLVVGRLAEPVVELPVGLRYAKFYEAQDIRELMWQHSTQLTHLCIRHKSLNATMATIPASVTHLEIDIQPYFQTSHISLPRSVRVLAISPKMLTSVCRQIQNLPQLVTLYLHTALPPEPKAKIKIRHDWHLPHFDAEICGIPTSKSSKYVDPPQPEYQDFGNESLPQVRRIYLQSDNLVLPTAFMMQDNIYQADPMPDIIDADTFRVMP